MELADREMRFAIAFHQRLLADRDAGDEHDLAHYLRAFPGREELVAREYLLAHGEESASTSTPTALPAGGELGPYRLVRELGCGGQGVVFEAEDTRLERRVALKLLSGLSEGDEPRLRRFRREAEITSSLSTPSICAVYDVGIERGIPYLAMQLVEGETLQARIARDAKPRAGGIAAADRVREALTLFERLARELHAAHEAGIIHRDVKPGNVMINADGQPVILDFGLARGDDGGGSLTRTGDVFGTPAYMSPEQLAENRIAIDRRTDVYSLGVSLYEVLTLRRPFDRPSREAIYLAILNRDATPLRRLDSAFPADLEAVLEAAMAKDRGSRYETAAALADDLRRILEGRPTSVRPVSRLTRVHRWARRNPVVAALAAAVFLAVSAFAIHAEVARRRAADDAVAIRRRNAELERVADLTLLRRLDANAAALWPCTPEMIPSYRLWLAETEGIAARLADHVTALDLVAGRGREATRDERRRQLAREVHYLETLERKRELVADALDDDASGPRSALLKQDAELSDEIARMETVLDQPLLSFDDPEDGTRYDVYRELVDLVRGRFLDPEHGLIRDVRARLVFAETARARSIDDHAEAWARARDEIASEPAYGGLELGEVAGLVPLGADPSSKLQEFLHLQTNAGAIPLRDDRGRLRLTGDSGLIFVLIPAGTARVGARDDPAAADHETPVHEVALDAFFMAKHEITAQQWERSHFVSRTEPAADTRLPAVRRSWQDCSGLLARLGLEFPTETQWEYAARAGTDTPWWTGADEASLLGAANLGDVSFSRRNKAAGLSLWSRDDRYPGLAPVDALRPNPFGLHHVHGNVAEWVRDPFTDYRLPALSGNGERLDAGQGRVARGGSCSQGPVQARSSHRAKLDPNLRGTIGLRPAFTRIPPRQR